MDTFFVVLHAFLWSAMEVAAEGKRGWMYDSQTACSGILAFTNYHVIMNLIAPLTVFFVMRRSELNPKHFKLVFFYNVLLWFVCEDVGWFVMNKMEYRTAPWQTTAASVLSTVVPVWLLYVMKKKQVKRDTRFDCVLIPVILYIWCKMPWSSPFDPDEPFNPRRNYCN